MKREDTTTVLAIRQTLENSGPQAVERQLSVIGNNVGDQELALVVQALLPGEVAAIIGEWDYTRPSIACHFITPQQFLGALEHFGARWGRLQGQIRGGLIERMRSELADFVFSVILTKNSVQRKSFLEILLADELGQDVLITLALDEIGCPEFLREISLHSGAEQKGTWQELYVEIENIDPTEFLALKKEILALYPEDFDADGNRSHPAGRFIGRTIRALSRRAAELVQSENPLTNMPKKEVFVGV